MSEKTNAMRWLDAQRIPYEPFYFSPTIHSADGVAAALGLPASLVYKTLVVKRERGHPLLVMVAGDRELDLRKLGRAVGDKSLSMATQREAERLTGLLVGGISALALLNRGFDVYIDKAAEELEWVLVSAGRRGINVRLRVYDLIRLTKATFVDVANKPPK